MKLGQLREDRDLLTGKLSEIVRQLDLAGIAIIWIFRTTATTDTSGATVWSKSLLWPLWFLVLSLGCDLLQYAWQSFYVDKRCRQESKGDRDDDSDVPGHSPYYNWPTRIFFWSKAGFAVIALVMLMCHISQHL